MELGWGLSGPFSASPSRSLKEAADRRGLMQILLADANICTAILAGGNPYSGWTKSISHHLRNPEMMFPLQMPTNSGFLTRFRSSTVCFFSLGVGQEAKKLWNGPPVNTNNGLPRFQSGAKWISQPSTVPSPASLKSRWQMRNPHPPPPITSHPKKQKTKTTTTY